VLHSAAPARSWSFIGPISVFLVIALLSTLVFGSLRDRERNQKRRDFVMQAQQLAFSIETSFDLPTEILRSVAALFVSSDQVSRDEFRAFVQPIIGRHHSIYAFEWMPLVEDAERDDFVRTVRAEGFPDFHVQQKNEFGELMLSERRADYLPILYMEPLEAVVLGLDVIGNPERGDESHRARATRSSTASDRYSLIEDPDDVFSVISYEPVLKTNADTSVREFAGLVGVLLRIEPVVREAISGGGSDGIHILLRDESASPGKQVLFVDPPDAKDLEVEAAWTREFGFAERRWSVRLTPIVGSSWTPGQGPVVLWVAGILLGILAAFASSAQMRIGDLRKRVDEAEELGQYRLGRRLGEGGMGIVYRAEHRMLARPAAIKLIRPTDTRVDREAHQRLLDRFEREAQATAALRSAHTIQVYDFGRTDRGEFYYVMELLDGLDLDTLVAKTGPVRPARVIHVLRQACRSLAEAHVAGLVHRDIKPANIYLCRHGLDYDFTKVLDFGLVHDSGRNGAEEPMATSPGMFVGTPAFCAPEMADGRGNVDGRSDIYSLGCVAYWLLTGRAVFERKTSLEVLVAHLSEIPEPPSAVSELDIHPELESIVLSCLEKDPDLRPGSAEELARCLEACPGSGAWTQERARRWWREHRPASGAR
jgi:CHASE1-domain containing sensor protein/tRNA A-37 threonylcarbamoyl transferase component Bud32